MEDKICLDTDFLVNFLRGKKEEKDYVTKEETKSILATTYINLFELYYGAYKSGKTANILQVQALQNRLRIINLSTHAMQDAGKILYALEKKGKKIDFRDLLIGCIAKAEGYAVKTHNLRDFKRIEELRVTS